MDTPQTDDNLDEPLASAEAETVAEEISSRNIDDLTLAELIGQFVRSPRATLRAMNEIAATPVNAPLVVEQPSQPTPLEETTPQQAETLAQVLPVQAQDVEVRQPLNRRRAWMQFGMYLSAFSLAFWGCLILVSAETRYEAGQLRRGTPFLLMGFIIWLGTEIYQDWPRIREYLANLRKAEPTDEDESAPDTPSDQASSVPRRTLTWEGIHPIRVLALLGTIVFCFIAWEGTQNNQFRTVGFIGWLGSVILILIAVAPLEWLPDRLLSRWRQWWREVNLWSNWVVFGLILVVLLAAFFRLYDLKGVPPEMTSDHIEKILDSQRVVEGDRDVFFTNNGGREAFQMYAMALLSQLPGMGMDFNTLKLLAVIEGVLTMPFLWWLGREIVGAHDRKLGNLVGVMLAALVAVSYWHVAITRLSLRIVLTPLVTSILLIFLVRAMRYNRRADFILAGLTLGFGLYTYQAVRMLPIVVVMGVILAFVYRFRERKMRWMYVQNLTILVVVSFVVFVPLFRYSVDFPESFWRRTAGRLLGDDVIQETDLMGNIVERRATFQERAEAFADNLPVLTSNIRNALLMYNWKGDVAWINGVPNYPVMDSISGAFLIVGLAAWVALVVRRRGDPVYLLIPLTVFVMLLPSALSIAAPLENPSATRTSGSLPPVYLIAALPLALIVMKLNRLLPNRTGKVLASGFAGIAILGAFSINADVYFNDYRASYDHSWRPHSEPGQVLQGFAISDGGYGNAFLVHHEHWLDHRIVGLEGGILDWDNAIISSDKIPDFLHDAWRCVEYKYRLDPDRDLMFFMHQLDAETEEKLSNWFPEGRTMLFESRTGKDDFKIYRVPAVGEEALTTWVETYKHDPRCWFVE